MAPTNKESGDTRTVGAHVFQTVQYPELDTLGLVAIREFLKMPARYLRLRFRATRRTEPTSVRHADYSGGLD
jgi:hypothetical protein